MERMEGKVALVTGAAVGAGRAIAVTYGNERAKVVVNYSKSREEAEETASLVHKAGGEALVIQADVAQDQQVRAMISQTLERFGRIDVLVNNAAITSFVNFPDLEALTDDVWDRMHNVNVKGTFFCCRAVVPQMRKQGHGRIINIASISGIYAQGSSIPYCTSKAAVIHLSKCLARTLAPEIRVNVIVPGTIADTRWNAGRPNLDAIMQKSAQAAPLKRVGKPEDIAKLALFLAIQGDFMTGNLLVIDGGRLLG